MRHHRAGMLVRKVGETKVRIDIKSVSKSEAIWTAKFSGRLLMVVLFLSILGI